MFKHSTAEKFAKSCTWSFGETHLSDVFTTESCQFVSFNAMFYLQLCSTAYHIVPTYSRKSIFMLFASLFQDQIKNFHNLCLDVLHKVFNYNNKIKRNIK